MAQDGIISCMDYRRLLEVASVETIHARFYVDGYHGYLLAKELASLQIGHWKRVRAEFGSEDRRFEIFDFNPTPEKFAEILSGLLLGTMKRLIAKSAENLFKKNGIEVIPWRLVETLTNPFSRGFFAKHGDFTADGKLYVNIELDGAVFAPAYNRQRLLKELDNWEKEERSKKVPDSDLLSRIALERRTIESGKFEITQRFYGVLAEKLGRLSSNGYLRVERDNSKKLIGEKAVDEDLNSALWSDAWDRNADLYILVTNDGDHAPHADQLRRKGIRISLVSYKDQPASALQKAIGPENILNFKKDVDGFDFSYLWLKDTDKGSVDALIDIQRQWDLWMREGRIRE